jgi:tetratricopeptide (TPR) repeat protein
MQTIIDLINNMRGKPWFSELLIILFFVVLYFFQKISETEKFLRWRIKVQTDSYDAHFKLGMLLNKNENSRDEALVEFKKAINTDQQRVDAYYQLYLLQNRRKEEKEADETLMLLADRFPNDALACVWKGMDLRKSDEKAAEEFFFEGSFGYTSFSICF